jgi:hypothetical protein
LTIEELTGSRASGQFVFDGKDLATDASVRVTDGEFQVTLLGGN